MIEFLAMVAAQSAPPPPQQPDEDPKPVVSGTDSCLPLRLADGLPIISATLAGRELNLGFDTGAPGAPGMKQQVIAGAKLPEIGEAIVTDPSGKNPLTVGLFELRDLKIGNVTIEKWLVAADPPRPSRRLAEPDGIIGLTAFEGFVVTYDYPGRRVLLRKGRLPEPDGRSSFRYKGRIPSVPLTIDGKPSEAHIDTGNARYGIIVPEALAAQTSGYSLRYPIGTARTINNTFDLMAAPVRESKVGEFALHAGTVAFPSVAGRANVGSLLLQDMVLKVDPANKIVSLERARPGLENGCPNA